MSDAPTKCPTCGTAVPAGAARCPGCGRVFGEANRCPHCNAIAAVRRKGAGYVCVACGGARQVGPGTTVLGDEGPTRVEQLTVAGVDPASRALARLVRLAGVMLVAAGLVAGAAGFVAPGAPIVLMMVVAAALGISGITAMSQAARVETRARERRKAQLERRILGLAELRGGELTATDVAKELHLGLEEADATLTAMADGARVSVEVDADGIVHYVFREIVAKRGPKVRVETSEAEEIAAEAAARVERELQKRERL
ncbi:zinc ribbon domain-containing protein [Sandaracinus amylolyticus]|uniref:zinc ribbon domain-containing protein n=1 Tax=Sandaracinus amylolyticus TaxID=927083 RepID=UPI001F205BC6|nr:zinc ribbon domain-containing protein [Sandaracinus amylolyticus]UJR81605.1 Hypothetical protein I5071_36650 [Sandaracinus amylolyticus]